ncbi:hypothetical protein [Solilutibacter silvestris]|uniref:hypothetical protein n=1 Tax=Solilutibacter silvestris TaxID=1645665 RepID=UPI003D32CC75
MAAGLAAHLVEELRTGDKYSMPMLTKIYSAALFLGGIFGVLISCWNLYVRRDAGLANLLFLLLFIAAFSFSAYIGQQRWKNTSIGRKWAPVLYASQIPMVLTTPVTFQWFTGIQMAPLLRMNLNGGGSIGFALNAGAGFDLHFNSNPAGGIVIGLNLFAISALIHLVRAN